MEASRPDPDTLLSLIHKEESKQQRGKLKIFFGMVAGVGKTYAMLEAGRERRSEGVDVVVGYVETHGRDRNRAPPAGNGDYYHGEPWSTGGRDSRIWTSMRCWRAAQNWRWWTS